MSVACISQPISKSITGEVRPPSDKSMSHRSILFSAIAEGTATVSHLLTGEDVLATAAACRAIGADIEINVERGLAKITGLGGKKPIEPDHVLDCGNSGTSTRLLCGVLASYPILSILVGDQSLQKRPMKRVTDPLSQMGASFMSRDGGRLPLAIKGSDSLQGIDYKSPVASAQVKSAILLAGLNAKGLTSVTEPRLSRDHSEKMLGAYGVTVTRRSHDDGSHTASVAGGQTLTCPNEMMEIPADPSSAAFLIAVAMMHPGSDLLIRDVCMNPSRIGFITTVKEMGADISFENEREQCGEQVADIRVRGTDELKAVEVPAERIPSMVDEVPILSMVAAVAKGTTIIHDLSELRVKESDRLQSVADALIACGIEVETSYQGEDDVLVITGGDVEGGVTLPAHLDHRLAMSYLILGSVAKSPIGVDNAAAIKTSFPVFIELMNSLGLEIKSVS